MTSFARDWMFRYPASLRRLPFAVPVILSAAFSVCVATGPLCAQGPQSKLQGQYQSENEPVRKARVLAKLGPTEVNEAGNSLKAGDDEKALSILEHYRDQVKETVGLLESTRINPQQHPSGFKELQISLRNTIRQVGDMDLRLPTDRRPWFDAVRSDLSSLQNDLFEALFPTGGETRDRTER